jgi:hypothetical protein
VFQKRVLKKILEPKNDEVTEEWRRLHKEELCGLYSAPNIIQTIKSRRMRSAGHVGCMGDRRDLYRVLVGKPEGKRQFGTPRRKWENIKMHFHEVGCGYRVD